MVRADGDAMSTRDGTLASVKIHASSRLHTDTAAEPHRWTVEGDDYARAAVPEGWALLSVQVER